MTPTHTNKKGVRYRYYVSQALLRRHAPSPLRRVAAPELEATVVDAIRRHLQESGTDPRPLPETDRELIERYLRRVTLSANKLTLHMRTDYASGGPEAGLGDAKIAGADMMPENITIPWTVPAAPPVKGIIHVPAYNTPMKPGDRAVLLITIAKARKWIKEIERGHSFTDIARREGKAERHIRRLAPLAFLSPRIVTAIIDGIVPAPFAATALAKRLPYSWSEQEPRMSMPHLMDGAIQNGK
jgi:site-specific DNA recombinase